MADELKEISSIAEDVCALIQVINDSCKQSELFKLSAVLDIAYKKQIDVIEKLCSHVMWLFYHIRGSDSRGQATQKSYFLKNYDLIDRSFDQGSHDRA